MIKNIIFDVGKVLMDFDPEQDMEKTDLGEKTIEMYPYMMEWLQELKSKGYRLYVLSNYSEQLMKKTKDKLKFLSLLDGALFSYECAYAKPKVKIFEHFCQKFDLNCSECVFVDDRIENVEGAQRSGILALQYTGYEQGKERLEEMLQY